MADGTFRRRPNGRIEYRFRYGGRQYSVTGATQRECRRRKEKRLAELSAGAPEHMADITLREYSTERLARIALDIKPSSLLSYQKKYRRINARLGDKRIRDITRHDVFRLREELAGALAPATVNYYISLLNTTLNDAIADGIIMKNPAFRVKQLKSTGPKATETNHRALSLDEQRLLFDYLKSADAWYYELFAFQTLTGMRIGECCALCWGDISDGLIHVHATVSQVGIGMYVVSQTTKTAAGKREIPVNDRITAILKRQREKLLRTFGIHAVAAPCRIFVPRRDCGAVLRPTNVNRSLQWIIKAMNREGIAFAPLSTHALRDTFATRCVEQGMQPLTLSKLLGHTKIAMTMDLYAHVMQETKVDAMRSIEISV